MNFLPSLISKALGYFSGASATNPKATNSLAALAVLAGVWFGIDAGTFANAGAALCNIGTTLQKVPSFNF